MLSTRKYFKNANVSQLKTGKILTTALYSKATKSENLFDETKTDS